MCFWKVVVLRRLKPRGPDQSTRLTAQKQNVSHKMKCCRVELSLSEGRPP